MFLPPTSDTVWGVTGLEYRVGIYHPRPSRESRVLICDLARDITQRENQSSPFSGWLQVAIVFVPEYRGKYWSLACTSGGWGKMGGNGCFVVSGIKLHQTRSNQHYIRYCLSSQNYKLGRFFYSTLAAYV